MRKMNRILLSMAVCAVCLPQLNVRGEGQKNDSFAERRVFETINKPLPDILLAFQKLDFDGRMEQQEYLCLKYHEPMFINVLCHHIFKSDEMTWDDRMTRSMEMVFLGREAASLPRGISVRGAIDLCGMKRLSALMAFKDKHKDSFFLKDKDDFYRGGLNAEMDAISEIGVLFDVDDWIELKKAVLDENMTYARQNDHIKSPYYRNEIKKRALNRFKRTQQITLSRNE